MAWLIAVLMVFCLPGISQAQTDLAKAASTLSAGSWVLFPTNNFQGGQILQSVLQGGGSVLEFGDEGHWNPVNNTVMIIGASHFGDTATPCNNQLFSILTDSNNTWSQLTKPCSTGADSGPAHEYHHAAMNPNTGDLYHRQYFSPKVMKFSQSTQLWSQCTAWGGGNFQVGGALEYFPERNSLVFLDGDWGVWELSLAAGNCIGSWVQRASTSAGGFSPQLWPSGIGPYHNQSRYSSNCQCIVMGGGNGNNRIWRYYADGTWSQGASPPFGNYGIPFAGSGDIFTRDPVTGNILVWYYSNANTTMYEYNPTTNVWTTISRSAPIFPGPEGGVTETFAIPISAYGVILFAQASSSIGGTARVYLYKHAAGVADTQAPTIPTGLTLTVISSTQINLSWTASTDNVGGSGVAGYSVRRCSPTACNPVNEVYTPTGTSQNDTGLTPDTPYGYSVAARDGAGNLSLYSPAVYARTQVAGGATFAARCAAAGVFLCLGFDSASDLGTIGGNSVGGPRGIFHNGQTGCNTTVDNHCPTLDTSVKSDGASSIKFVIAPGKGGDDSGQWFTSFAQDYSRRFGSNTTFFLQYRYRVDSTFYNSMIGQTWPKQSIIGSGSTASCTPGNACPTWQGSCSALELVLQNNMNTYGPAGLPQMYHNCGDYAGISDPGVSSWNSNDYRVQNARPNPPGCWYYHPNFTAATTVDNCIPYYANEWMTFKTRVDVGTYNAAAVKYQNSRVRLWMAREGQASIALIDKVMDLHADNLEQYGNVWLLTYSTGQTWPNGGTAWYDELIISTQDIADPGATIIPPGPLSVTINTNSGNNFTTSASSAVLTGTATGPGF